MNTENTLSQGSIILIVTFFIGAMLTFAFAVSMGWLLTPSEYGMLGVTQALIAIIGLFITAAFPWVTAKFMAEPARQDKPTVFKSSLLANLGLACLLCLLLFLGYRFRWLPLGHDYQSLMIVIIVYVLIASIGAIYRGSLQGLLKFNLALLGFGVLGVITGYIIAALISLVFLLYYTRGQGFLIDGSWKSKEVYSFALPISDIMAGYYRASLTISRIPVYLITAIMVAFLPLISYYASNKQRVNYYSIRTVKYALIFILPLCLTIFVIPKSLIVFIFPESYIAGATALRILSIGMFFLALSYIYASVFQGVGKPKIPAFIMLGAITIQIVCLYMLVPRYGLTGAAVSTTSACSLAFILLQYMHAKHFGFGFSVTDLGKITLASVALVPVLYFFPMPGRALTVVGLLCGLGVFFAILVVTKVLHHTDADILLSGVFDKESRFRAKVVNLVRILNREAMNLNSGHR